MDGQQSSTCVRGAGHHGLVWPGRAEIVAGVSVHDMEVSCGPLHRSRSRNPRRGTGGHGRAHHVPQHGVGFAVIRLKARGRAGRSCESGSLSDSLARSVIEDHVYKVVELFGSSKNSIEDAIERAIKRADHPFGICAGTRSSKSAARSRRARSDMRSCSKPDSLWKHRSDELPTTLGLLSALRGRAAPVPGEIASPRGKMFFPISVRRRPQRESSW